MSLHPFSDLSVIIPLGPQETEWRRLVLDLRSFWSVSEIILVYPEGSKPDWTHEVRDLPVRWVETKRGRAFQMNAGAKAATRRFLWFLHADSRLSSSALQALETRLRSDSESLHYFNLKFQSDGPILTRLNTLGVWFRSHALGIPFGDQGFCVSKEVFERLGEFDVSVERGEDHLFVWKARRRKVKLHCIEENLVTSARKYRREGWLKTTLENLVITATQALPEYWKELRGK